MTTTIRQFIKIGALVGLVLLLGALLLSRPIGATFANGSGLQLTVDSYSVYNGVFQEGLSWELKDLVPGVDKFFNFDDIKPGDTGVNVISIHLDEPAYVCLDLTNLEDQENGQTEPEMLVDYSTTTGELSEAMEFFAWRDDGDNVFEVGEEPLFGTTTQAAVDTLNNLSYPLADATTQAALEPDQIYYVGITWCAGDLVVDMGTAEVTCDAEVMGNKYQTDSFTLDVSLRAVEATSYTDYTCDPEVELYLNKQISGVDLGYEPSDFSYRITGEDVFTGEDIDIIAPHDSFTMLPPGTYTIEELVPEDFVKEDWRIGWYGQCEKGSAFSTTITIEPRDIRKNVLYCEADNQYRPGDDNGPGNNGHGNDEDGNDDSNPGSSNDPVDDTDDDGTPGRGGDRGASRGQSWSVVEPVSWVERIVHRVTRGGRT